MKVERRRGISPIIAELILVAVTVALGTTIFYIGTSSIGGVANGFSVLFGKSANNAQEIYVVEYVHFASNNVTLTVRNVGFIETQVADISLFALTSTTGSTAGTFSSSQITVNHPSTGWCTKSGNYITIPVGNFCTLSVGFNWGTGAPAYNVVVSTQRGNSIVVQEVA